MSHFKDDLFAFAATATFCETELRLSSTVFRYLGGTIPDTDCKPYASIVEKNRHGRFWKISKKSPETEMANFFEVACPICH
jgi:hypothetical protein